MRGARSEIRKPWILRQIGPPERADQPNKMLLPNRRHNDPAVTGSIGASRHVQLPWGAALQDMFGELVAEDRRRALRQADLDPLALAAALAGIEGDTQGLCRIEPGQGVDDDRPDPVGRTIIAEID